MERLVAGLDLGSTGIKLLVADESGREVLISERKTPWDVLPDGATVLEPGRLLGTLRELFGEAGDALQNHADGARRVESISVAGMGETGFLVNETSEVVTPAYAWFDNHGAQQVEELPHTLRRDFAGRTGLPWGVQVSAAKILYLRDQGVGLAGLQWLNLPEFVITMLGGPRVSEMSLASRTGLLDQDTAAPWGAMLDHLGVDSSFIPEIVDASTPLGGCAAAWLPRRFRGATLSIAGHDHLVSSVAAGATADGGYLVSMGTAEVLLRIVSDPLDFAARTRLGDALINCVRHVVPGQYALVAGVKTGLLMRRALQLFGVEGPEERDRLDRAVLALMERDEPVPGLEVSGARNDDGVLQLRILSDGVTPAHMLRALLQHGNDEVALLIKALDEEVPPATTSLLTGGWAAMQSVREARSQVLPVVLRSERAQDTAFGAALNAARHLEPADVMTQEK